MVKLSQRCALVSLMMETAAYGYTDPGSGALLWQILVGALVGLLFYVRKAANWLSGKRKTGN